MADKKKIGRPTVDNPKNIQMRIRLTVEENEILTECAETLETTKSDVFIRGMRKVYDEIKKKKEIEYRPTYQVKAILYNPTTSKANLVCFYL